MNITNHLIQRKLLEEKESIISFIIHGQGVFIFSVNDAKSCKLKFHDSTKENAIEVELDTKGFTIKQIDGEAKHLKLEELGRSEINKGLHTIVQKPKIEKHQVI